MKKLWSEEVKVGVNSMQDTDKVSLKLYQEQKNLQEHIKKQRQKIKWRSSDSTKGAEWTVDKVTEVREQVVRIQVNLICTEAKSMQDCG